MASLEITPLTGTLGAEVGGVDVRAVDDDTTAAIRAALVEYRVIFFRDQELTPADLVAFGSRFGPLTDAHPISNGLKEQPEVLLLDTERQPKAVARGRRAAGGYKWHTDVTFIEEPPLGSLLHALVIPPRGGDTQWADTVDAYAKLSEPLRDIVDGLVAVHDGRRVFGQRVKLDPTGRAQEKLDALPPTRHPVVRVHPESGERALFVNPAFTSHLDGFAPAESDAILQLLYDHIAQPERTVRWHWRVGDLAFWDNRSTAHYAVTDYGDAHRSLQRITIAGDRPFGPRDVTPENAVVGAG